MSKTVTIPDGLWKEFQELVQRGANLWPDASPALKAFADEVTVGKPMQDYQHLANIPKEKQSKGITVDDTAEMATAINVPAQQQIPQQPGMFYHTFASEVAGFNQMYGLGDFDATRMTKEAVLARMGELQRMLEKEVLELQDIIDKLNASMTPGALNSYKDPFEFLTDLADLMGDLQVYCMSEMLRWKIPANNVLSIIMASNASKMGEDGKPIIVDGKLQKGPNYWKPEPKIYQMLLDHFGEGPTVSPENQKAV